MDVKEFTDPLNTLPSNIFIFFTPQANTITQHKGTVALVKKNTGANRVDLSQTRGFPPAFAQASAPRGRQRRLGAGPCPLAAAPPSGRLALEPLPPAPAAPPGPPSAVPGRRRWQEPPRARPGPAAGTGRPRVAAGCGLRGGRGRASAPHPAPGSLPAPAVPWVFVV